ncbi:nucleotidyltransferase family protein [Niabella hirudinis]|uniref:nucleotidyltransferase family protein n=1 Tax=Niabella hirudinis TaxID=1285929 RepID=UPI003EBB799C
MAPEITNNINRITDLCKKMEVKTLYVFGSAARDTDFAENSDIDFIIEYDRDKTGMPPDNFDYFDLWFALEDITGRKVDLVVAHAIKNKYFRQSIEDDKILLYAA